MQRETEGMSELKGHHVRRRFHAVFLCFTFLSTSFISIYAHAESIQSSEYRALRLDDCLSLARKHNPVLSGATERIRELTADYQAAQSGFYPRLILTSHYERTNPDRLSTGGALTTQPLFKEEGLISVSGKQVLFDGGTTYFSARAAKKSTEAQNQEVRRTADEVTFSVTEAFYRLMEAKENLIVARESLQQRREFAALSEALFNAGKVTRLDSLRAQSQFAEAVQANVEAENAVRLARIILARSIGLTEEAPLEIQGQLPQEFAHSSDMDSLWREALETNPEIKKLDSEIEQSRIRIKAARGAYFPEVSLQGALGERHHDLGGTQGEWLAGVFMEIPLFEGGLTRAQVAKASSQYLQSLENKRDRLYGLKVILATAWQDRENARHGVVATRQIVAANEEAYASARALYRNGKAIGLDVVQAQVDLTASRFTLIRYELNLEISQARIRQILGSQDLESSRKNDQGGWKK
jgi:outer membrane protein